VIMTGAPNIRIAASYAAVALAAAGDFRYPARR
jgi:hypothetical protein